MGTIIFEPRFGPHEGAVGHNGDVPGYNTLLVEFPAYQLAVAVLVVGAGSLDDVALSMFDVLEN